MGQDKLHEPHAFNGIEALLLPPPLLTECHSAWLNTFDFLKPLVDLLPFPRVTRWSLSSVGFSNMLPSWPSRPILLAGKSASNFLASLIKPRARKLKHRCILPKTKPKPLPACFDENFQLALLYQFIAQRPSRNDAGGVLWSRRTTNSDQRALESFNRIWFLLAY